MTYHHADQPSFPLSKDEEALLAQINLDAGMVTHDTYQRNGDLVVSLLRTLIARKAIPEHRLKYFTDPEYSGLARGRSWNEIFERNGNTKEETVRHPSFLQHLRYFVFGPQLPQSVIDDFSRKVAGCGGVTSSDVIPLSDFARKQARTFRMNPHEADTEFYKLALDCGMSPSYASFVKRAVRGIRYR